MLATLILSLIASTRETPFAQNVALIPHAGSVTLFSLQSKASVDTKIWRSSRFLSSPTEFAVIDEQVEPPILIFADKDRQLQITHGESLLGWDDDVLLFRKKGAIESTIHRNAHRYSVANDCAFWIRQPGFEIKFFDGINARIERDGNATPLPKGSFFEQIVVNRRGEVAFTTTEAQDLSTIWSVDRSGVPKRITAQKIARRKFARIFIDEAGRFYYSTQDFVQSNQRDNFAKWTNLYDFSNRLVKRVRNEYEVAFLDSKTKTIYGLHVHVGHFGEDFVQLNLKTGRQTVYGRNIDDAIPLSVWWWDKSLVGRLGPN